MPDTAKDTYREPDMPERCDNCKNAYRTVIETGNQILSCDIIAEDECSDFWGVNEYGHCGCWEKKDG